MAIKKKIHSTWRLLYLKDVVLARILDDPTFSVLNSLIFFNQVDIVSHLQGNTTFLEELFGIIDDPNAAHARKKDAVSFIQTCCAIAKNIQAPGRQTLYANFIQNGLLRVINFALLNGDSSIRVAGTDILVAMIDHDASMVRAYIFRSIQDSKRPLTDTLIELLLIENDLGVKAQAADAIKVLLEPQQPPPPPPNAETMARNSNNAEFLSKLRGNAPSNPQIDSFIQNFYDNSANKLFKPLKDLEKRKLRMLRCSLLDRLRLKQKLTLLSSRKPYLARSLAFSPSHRDSNVLDPIPFIPKQNIHISRGSTGENSAATGVPA